MKKLAAVLLLFLATALLAADRWQPADRLRIVNASDPQVSPDGKSVAVVISRVNAKENRYDAEVVAIDVATGARRPLTFDRRGIASPRWSPDGVQIAFLANDKDAKRQVWILPFSSGGEARRLTSGTWSLPIAHPPGPAPSPLSWSPDGKTIAITRRETAHAGTPNMSRVALVDAATGEVRRLTSSDLDEGQPVFSPDG